MTLVCNGFNDLNDVGGMVGLTPWARGGQDMGGVQEVHNIPNNKR